MSYEIRQIKNIDNKNIKLGKTFKYGENYNLTNIYYLENNNIIPKEAEGRKQDSTDEKTKLIIQTPLLYIPNSLVYFNEKPFLELSFNNEDNDKDVLEFKEWLTGVEDLVYKLIKRRSTLKLDKSNMVSILKSGFRNNSSKLIVPINMNISRCILSDDGKRNKFLFNWEIPVPTYGISIIWIKNIWIKNGKWGINIFMYASRVMNSHILDPIDFIGDSNLDNKNIKTIDVIKHFAPNEKMTITVGNIPEFQMFFRMLKMGIPKDAVKQKMSLSGIDIRIVDYPDTAPYATVLHYLANPNLPPYIKSSSLSSSGGPPPPPPPPMMPMSMMNNFGGDAATRANLLNSISSGSFKLKKVDPEEIKANMVNKVAGQSNPKGLKVPTLSDIQGALSRLRKVEMDDLEA
jgi:hypothetical protein